jgi:lysophospholipase L1-like esterase
MTLVAFTFAAAFGAVSIGSVAGAGPAVQAPPAAIQASDGSSRADAIAVAVAVPASPYRSASPSVVPSASAPAAANTSVACASPSTTPDAGTQGRGQASLVPATVSKTSPVAAFLGDSYTTGYAGAGLGRAGWPAMVSAALGLRTLVRAVAGTGFVNPGWTGQPIRTRAGSVIGVRPRIVFLAAGHNDRRYATALTAMAADAVIDRLHRALPASLLVVIGPIWADGNPPAHIRALRDHLRRKAAAVGAIFIDPLRAGWFAGSWHRLILSDGIHPSDAGHRRIAALVLLALRGDQRFVTMTRGPIGSAATAATAATATRAALGRSPGCPS